jgi:hypothetical protein
MLKIKTALMAHLQYSWSSIIARDLPAFTGPLEKCPELYFFPRDKHPDFYLQGKSWALDKLEVMNLRWSLKNVQQIALLFQ